MKNRAALALFFLVAAVGCKRSAPVTAGGAPATETAQAASQVAPVGPRDTKAARAANRQGMKRYRQKDMAGAAAAFGAAIAADPKHVLAHYNLACVLALTGDKAGALAELGWLARSEDPAAARKLARAPEDADLKSLTADPQAVELFFAGTQRALFPGFHAAARGTPATEAQAAQLWGAWEHEPGEARDANEVVQAVSQELVAERKGAETLLASASRIALLDAGGGVVASVALDDADDRASVEHLWIGQVIPDVEPEIVLVTRWERGASHTITVTVYKRKAGDLVEIAGAEVYSYWIKLDDESDDPVANADESEDTGEIALRPDGTIQMRSSGDKRPQTLRWDPQAFKFVKR